MTSKRKKIVLGILAGVVALPATLVATILAWGYISDETNGTLLSSEVTRRYLLYVPKTYDRSRPAPLVISLHPGATWPAFQRNISHWNDLADRHGFLVVYPAGRGAFFGGYGRGQSVFHTGLRSGAREVKFVSDLIDGLQAHYNIDADRVYANGMSNGGAMAFLLSCKLPDRIAAVGIVSGELEVDPEDCGGSRPVPRVIFHGTADKFAPYRGGSSPVAPGLLPDVAGWTSRVAQHNQCQQHPADITVSPNVHRLAYVGCASHSEVTLYIIEGGGHTWPGGEHLPEWIAGHTTDDVNASQTMWQFFVDHPRESR